MEHSKSNIECCNIDDWMTVSSSKSKVMCKVHGTIFNISERCPSRNGKSPVEMNVKVEQGLEQGLTNTNKANFDKLSSSVLEASKVSHAFRFVVTIQNPLNWSDRRKTLELKGLNVELKGGIGRVYKTVFKGFKIWLADKSITIYFPNWKKYYVDEARFGYNFALADLKDYLDELGKFMDCSFLIDGSYRFKCSGQHHALIYNSLAKMFNRNKEKLNVYDSKGELWLLIDNSRRESIRMDDIESVNKSTAVKDMDDVVAPFFNQLRESGLTVNDILNGFNENNEQIKALVKDREYYAENLKSHVEAIKVLSSSVNELKEQVIKNSTVPSKQEVSDEVSPNIPCPIPSLKTISKYDVERKEKIKRFIKEYGW